MNKLNFTFEIISYFKCRSNGSSRPHLNQMLEFSLNRPTTRVNTVIVGSILFTKCQPNGANDSPIKKKQTFSEVIN